MIFHSEKQGKSHFWGKVIRQDDQVTSFISKKVGASLVRFLFLLGLLVIAIIIILVICYNSKSFAIKIIMGVSQQEHEENFDQTSLSARSIRFSLVVCLRLCPTFFTTHIYSLHWYLIYCENGTRNTILTQGHLTIKLVFTQAFLSSLID